MSDQRSRTYRPCIHIHGLIMINVVNLYIFFFNSISPIGRNGKNETYLYLLEFALVWSCPEITTIWPKLNWACKIHTELKSQMLFKNIFYCLYFLSVAIIMILTKKKQQKNNFQIKTTLVNMRDFQSIAVLKAVEA